MQINTDHLNCPINYICFDCNDSAIGRNRHVLNTQGVSVSIGECHRCNESKPVAHIRDFGWPIFEVNDE